jgi:hypothetical protein
MNLLAGETRRIQLDETSWIEPGATKADFSRDDR